ncbi:hypothetical protein [Pedobacter sp.]|uniref:hypothetical protein n=1 Tax=Pedobacter sp. TaxID=1411316 RepID=UPI003D7FB1EE
MTGVFAPELRRCSSGYFSLVFLILTVSLLFYFQVFWLGENHISFLNIVYLPNDIRWYLDFIETKFFLIIYVIQAIAFFIHAKLFKNDIKNRMGYALVLNLANILIISIACFTTPNINIFLRDDVIVEKAINSDYTEAINLTNKKYESELDRNYIISQFRYMKGNDPVVNESIINARTHIHNNTEEYVKANKYRLSTLSSVSQKSHINGYDSVGLRQIFEAITFLLIICVVMYSNYIYLQIERGELPKKP